MHTIFTRHSRNFGQYITISVMGKGGTGGPIPPGGRPKEKLGLGKPNLALNRILQT